MSTLVGILGIALPIITFLVSPTRTIGRGGRWVLVGAALLVGTMMLMFFDVLDVTDYLTRVTEPGASTSTDADAAALASLFGDSP